MEKDRLSEKAKALLATILSGSDKWLIEDVEKIYKEASDEEDFLEELDLYVARLEMKLKRIKQEFEKFRGAT